MSQKNVTFLYAFVTLSLVNQTFLDIVTQRHVRMEPIRTSWDTAHGILFFAAVPRVATGNNQPAAILLVRYPVFVIHPWGVPLFGSYQPHANACLVKCFLTVVVLTRPPGCVHVQPEWLRSRWQTSSSKHGVISHHLCDWTMSTECGYTEEKQVRGGYVPKSSTYLGE